MSRMVDKKEWVLPVVIDLDEGFRSVEVLVGAGTDGSITPGIETS